MKAATGAWLAGVGMAGAPALAQTAGGDPPAAGAEPASVPVDAPATKAWELSLAVTLYSVPDDRDYVQPTFAADHDWLHLEARYNYEDADTGSLWAGYNFSGGKEFTWQVTPMLGGVFGNTTGVAPGYEVTLNWWKLELCSEGEYVVDLGDESESFFYSWTELSVYPVEWFRVGLVGQRTRLYESGRDFEPGVLAGVSFENVDVTAYVVGVDDERPTLQVTVGVSF